MSKSVEIYFDGACDNNSKFKFMGIGVAVFIEGEYKEELCSHEMHGTNGTNNIAEWRGLEMAMETAKNLLATYANLSIRIYGDSQIIVKQFNGDYKINKEHFLEYYHRCKAIERVLLDSLVGVHWIRRENNTHADILSKKGITDYLEENNML